MFRQSNRGTYVWLFIVGVALLLAMLAGDMPLAAAAALLAGYLLLAVAITRNFAVGNVVQQFTERTNNKAESSETAREASARARTSPDYEEIVQLLDIGLIADEQRPDGMSLRRGRFISMDDDGIRPFAIVQVPPLLAEQICRVRFEIRDEKGEMQYVYEDEKWLQAGENALLPDYRLPIRGNKNELQPGAWNVSAIIEGGLIGVHNFSLTPSLAARRRNISSDGEIRERVWRSQEEDESLPLSLEELLRQQSRQKRQS